MTAARMWTRARLAALREQVAQLLRAVEIDREQRQAADLAREHAAAQNQGLDPGYDPTYDPSRDPNLDHDGPEEGV